MCIEPFHFRLNELEVSRSSSGDGSGDSPSSEQSRVICSSNESVITSSSRLTPSAAAETSPPEEVTFNSFLYWREPLANIELPAAVAESVPKLPVSSEEGTDDKGEPEKTASEDESTTSHHEEEEEDLPVLEPLLDDDEENSKDEEEEDKTDGGKQRVMQKVYCHNVHTKGMHPLLLFLLASNRLIVV